MERSEIVMTLQQQAYGLINQLSDESVYALIQVMMRMLPHEHDDVKTEEDRPGPVSSKMKAYLRMQELRKETAKYEISEEQRAAALDEKYGTFG
ncbi:MAG: hypothetical protein K5841_02815 [Fretibacterium sp.]|nr:hypothetical protein [Fretibacterium sp.]